MTTLDKEQLSKFNPFVFQMFLDLHVSQSLIKEDSRILVFVSSAHCLP
jgi:hypothetical protein